MSERDDGGRAFPWCGDLNETPTINLGMTLRDYFIAHAPAEPQAWFEPVMPHPRPQPPKEPQDLTEEEREDKAGYMDDMLNVGDMRSNRLAAYLRERESWLHWLRAWEKDAAKQRLVQWPAAWADEMLKARQA